MQSGHLRDYEIVINKQFVVIHKEELRNQTAEECPFQFNESILNIKNHYKQIYFADFYRAFTSTAVLENSLIQNESLNQINKQKKINCQFHIQIENRQVAVFEYHQGDKYKPSLVKHMLYKFK